jgi:Nuclease-related domain
VQVIKRSSTRQTKTKNETIVAFLFFGASLLLIVVPTVVFGVGILAAIGWVGGLVLLAVAIWYGWQAWQKQQENLVEERLEAMLGQFLGNDFIYFRNLVLPDIASIGEIDGVLLGPHGAVVLRVEHQPGEFICEGDTWYKYTGTANQSEPVLKPLGVTTITEVQRRRLEDSPSWQAIRATREVKAWLSVRDLPQILVQPVVVLSKGKLHSSKVPSCQIIQLNALESYLKSRFVPVDDHISLSTVEQITLRLQAGK